MHATHKIPTTVEPAAASEADFRCYPLRGDSLSLYCDPLDHKLRIDARDPVRRGRRR